MIIKEINIDLKNDEKVNFPHFYGATGYANADYTYTPALRRMYDMYDTYKGYPKYMRLHNIMTLHGKGDKYILDGVSDYGNPYEMGRVEVDTVVLRDDNGTLIYNWEYVDKVYDIIIDHGMKPIVEAVYIPTSIRKSREEYYIPGDYKEFYRVIQSFVNHWIDRYGIEEVKTWYFEIFNEPDMHISFVKNAYAFNALYDYFEAAIHDINSDLIVGGPAVKQWNDAICVFEQFIEHINNGLNYVSGKFGTRIDFISIHSKGGYPTINGPDFNYMFDPIRKFASILEKYPKMKDVPFINDESDIVWEGNLGVKEKSWLNFRNTEYAAGFTCKM
jgi:xylan 1,4-beta-xylosidase